MDATYEEKLKNIRGINADKKVKLLNLKSTIITEINWKNIFKLIKLTKSPKI